MSRLGAMVLRLGQGSARGLLSVLGLALLLGLPTARALAAPTSVYLADSFDSANRVFYQGDLDQRKFAYVDGQYEIDTRAATTYGQSVVLSDLDTCRIQVTARMVQSDDPQGGGFGISFNYTERPGGSDFLLFLVYDRGAFTVLQYKDDRTTVLFSPTKTRLFEPGQPVGLVVETAKGQVGCFINGGEVARLSQDVLPRGGFGMFASAKSVVRFDDFQVLAEPAPAPKPAATPPPADLTAPPPEAGPGDLLEGAKTLYEGTWREVSYAYDGGRYIIDTGATNKVGLSPFPQDALNFELSVDVTLLAGDPVGGYGVYLRDFAEDGGGFSQFRFLVSGGWFAVEQSVDDRPLALAQWTEHAAVKPTGANRLSLRAQGADLYFYVNGTQVYHCTDLNPRAGAYGFYACAGIKVAFDNLSFKRLDD